MTSPPLHPFRIGSRTVGTGAPTFIIAELSANHLGEFDRAARLVEAAASAGADAVKLQTFTAQTITIDANRPEFRIDAGTAWDGRTLFDLYQEAATPWEWFGPLKDIATRLGMELFSSPFDSSAVEFLESQGVPAYKIASAEIVDVGLIKRVARTGKPVIISTGMAVLDEIAEAVGVARASGASDIALLKCTSAYPAPPEEANLRTISDMSDRFGVPVGLSDHTLGATVPVAAVSVGAAIIEKHLTLSRADGGPDAGFSSEPDEFRMMVEGIRMAEQALGSVSYTPSPHEAASRNLRRSLFAVADVARGEPFTEDNVRSIRPGHGLHTRHLAEILGRKAAIDIERGTPLAWELVDGSDR